MDIVEEFLEITRTVSWLIAQLVNSVISCCFTICVLDLPNKGFGGDNSSIVSDTSAKNTRPAFTESWSYASVFFI